ncbi:MAG: SRPBCC domain-containing protein [Candidatus Nitrotoga sp.]
MTTNNELTITRTFDAPRALVWQAWTNPKHIEQWWGPNGFTGKSCTLDLRAGGFLI